MTRSSFHQSSKSVFLLCVSGLLASSLGGVRTDAAQVLKVAGSGAENVQGINIASAVEEDSTSNEMPRTFSDATNRSGEVPINIGGPIQPDQLPPARIPDANPNRPSDPDSAEVLAPGVVQVEYGYTKYWESAGSRQMAIGGEIRYGVWRDFEFRLGSRPLAENLTPGGNAFGIGDQYFSGQFQFHKQTETAPALAVSYAVSLPTGNESLGLGSGRVNHTWTFLANKDLHNFSFYFNAQYELVGREWESGYDQNGVFYLAVQRTIHGPWSVIGEIGEATRLNFQSPTNSTTLGALVYKVNRRVVLDTAIDAGLTRGAPQKRVMFGVTYVIGKFY